MIGYIIAFVLGIIALHFYNKKYGKKKVDEEMNVRKALDYLKSCGYWVKLNVGPDEVKR